MQPEEREVDFIKRCIFPASCMPSPSALAAAGSGLRLWAADGIGLHLLANRDRIMALGYDDRLPPPWACDLRSCAERFLERALGAARAA